MTAFGGFSLNESRFTHVPDSFFTDLLPSIDHLGELRVTLYFFWRLGQSEEIFPYILESAIAGDETFLASFGASEKKARMALKESLDSAVGRGTLLHAGIQLNDRLESLYILNNLKGQAAIKAIEQGKWQPAESSEFPIKLDLAQPNSYRLYEEHIGPLTPIISDAIKDTEEQYPGHWIREAFEIAAKNNVRKWNYIEAILQRWQEEGRDERRDQKDPQKDRKKYAEGEYSDFIES